MTFRVQTNHVISRAKCVLGLVKRMSKGFCCPYVTKSLYTSLVRPILEYAVVAWSLHLITDINRIESLQKQFLLFALRGLNWAPGFVLPPYEARLQLINLDSLASRRLVAASIFPASCFVGKVAAPYLRNTSTFRNTGRSTRYSVVPKLNQLPCATRFLYPFSCRFDANVDLS